MPRAFLLVRQYTWEGYNVLSVWLDEGSARAEALRLNGSEHEECGSDPADCTCPYRVYPSPLRPCPACHDSGHVCENHPDRPWSGMVGPDAPNACGNGSQGCGGAGMPCPACCSPIPEGGRHRISEAFTPDHLR